MGPGSHVAFMTDPAHQRALSAMPTVRDALAHDIYWTWQGATLRYDGPLHEGHIFWIQTHNWNYRLVISHLAMLRVEVLDDSAELVDALRAQHWIDFLLEHTCGLLTLQDTAYLLRSCPSPGSPPTRLNIHQRPEEGHQR